jgi:hypothetical protein
MVGRAGTRLGRPCRATPRGSFRRGRARFGVDAVGPSERNLYLHRIENTHLARQIGSIIEEFLAELPHQRAPRMFPH